MNGYFTSLFYTGQVLSLPRISRVRTNKSHEAISIFFFFLEEEKSIWSWSLFVPFYLEIKEHMIHWFTSLRGSLGILSRRCKIIGSSAKKKKNSEAVPGYILELNVYFTQSFKILCRRRLLILRELGVRDHF